MLTVVSSSALVEEFVPQQCDCSRLHKVDAYMMPQSASRPSKMATSGVFLAHRRGMAIGADALSTPSAIASCMAPILARPGITRPDRRARRIFNVHAHADRCAPPGRDPGRGRQRKPDRGV